MVETKDPARLRMAISGQTHLCLSVVLLAIGAMVSLALHNVVSLVSVAVCWLNAVVLEGNVLHKATVVLDGNVLSMSSVAIDNVAPPLVVCFP